MATGIDDPYLLVFDGGVGGSAVEDMVAAARAESRDLHVGDRPIAVAA